MRRLVFSVLCLLWLSTALPRPAAAQSLVACGWDEVFILDISGAPAKTWRWKASEAAELPAAYRDKFRTTDDCKPVDGNRVLITASSDGAALVDRATRRTLWWAQCGNAHSAELLPGDRVVLACSVREGTGNRLALFDAATPEHELFSTPLVSAHGVVWDAARERLWALGLRELHSYRLRDWDSASPSLELDMRYALPDEGGHELSAVPGTAHLIVSTHAGVWRFDRDLRTFRPDPDLRGRHDIKSAVIHPTTRRLAYTEAERPQWWTRRIRFARPEGEVVLEGERLYKVRWVP
jgi:hypothetical protein